jgi:hypothetical protein
MYSWKSAVSWVEIKHYKHERSGKRYENSKASMLCDMFRKLLENLQGVENNTCSACTVVLISP